MDDTNKQLKAQIKFEQFVNSFYLDLLVNHALPNDGYFSFVMKLIAELKQNSTDEKTLNTELKNLPGVVYEKIKSGELSELLELNKLK